MTGNKREVYYNDVLKMQIMEFVWKRAGKKLNGTLEVNLKEIIKDLKMMGHEYIICIGTDSQRNGRRYKFATVVVVRTRQNLGSGVYVGRGGKMIEADYFVDGLVKGKAGVKERMTLEVAKSIEVAYSLSNLFKDFGIVPQIHADINPDSRWESNKAMNEAVGYILGMGYEFKIKPDSWASSFGADRCAQ